MKLVILSLPMCRARGG